MRSLIKHGMLGALALLLCLMICICTACAPLPSDSDVDAPGADNAPSDDEGGDEETRPQLDYSGVKLEEYVTSVTYKDLKIMLENEDDSKEDALWDAIFETALINGYPEDAVNYYFEQTKLYYMYIAEDDPETYELLLKTRDITEDDMREDAEELVKKDLIYMFIVDAEDISVSDEERAELFERYVETYVVEYGYNIAYVEANLTESIYESMIYDKTIEFLILNNTFEVIPEVEPES